MHPDIGKSFEKILANIPDDHLKMALVDILERIQMSRSNLKTKQHKAMFDRTLRAINGSDEKMTTESKVTCFYFAAFYCSHYEKCPSHRLYPSTPKYEAIIPCAETNETFAKVYIIPSGLSIGDKAVCSFHHWKLGDTDTMSKKGLERKRQINPEELNEFLEANRNNLLGNAESMVGLSMGGGIFTMTSEPSLRFPCYNVPQQVQYEMISAEIGDFWQDGETLIKNMRKADTTQIMLKRKRLHLVDFLAIAFYSTWQTLDFTHKEMHEHLYLMVSIAHKWEKEQTSVVGHFEPSSFTFNLKNGQPESLERFIKTLQRHFSKFFRSNHIRKVIATTTYR